MSIKTLMFSLLLASSLVSISTAKPKSTCASGSKYTLLDTSVPFGLTTDQTVSKAKRAFKGASVRKVATGVMVNFKRPYKNLDTIMFFTNNGVVTRILFSYHNNFIQSLGGLKDSMMILLKKLVDKYGKADNVNTDEAKSKGKVSATWNQNAGMSMAFIAQDPSSLLLRFDCDVLEAELQQEASKNANFGI